MILVPSYLALLPLCIFYLLFSFIHDSTVITESAGRMTKGNIPTLFCKADVPPEFIHIFLFFLLTIHFYNCIMAKQVAVGTC